MTARRFRSTVTNPYDRGLEFGTAHAHRIQRTVAAYRALFDRAAGSPVDLELWGAQALSSIESTSANIAAEIRGIADGAGLAIETIAGINARTEILAAVSAPADTHSECSTVVILDPDLPPVAVQAWDWYAELADLWLVWEIPHHDGRTTTTVTEYGIVGKIGVNSDGLGILFNILHHDHDGNGVGVPVHVLARTVLDEATDMNQALTRIAAAAVTASSSLTIVAHKSSESAAVSVEVNPFRPGYALPDDNGILIHTNHFLSHPAALHDKELRNGPDTVVRLNGLRRQLVHAPRPLSVDEAIQALNSHLLGGGATCCHPDPTLPSAAQFETLATITLDIHAGTLTAHAGGPCTYPYDRNRRTLQC